MFCERPSFFLWTQDVRKPWKPVDVRAPRSWIVLAV